jgi:hypothetical protein
MQVVDHIGVGVPFADVGDALVPVRMASGQSFMRMLDDFRIAGGPEPCGCRHGISRDHGQDHRRRRKPEGRARPARERISDQPAGMRQRELGGE